MEIKILKSKNGCRLLLYPSGMYGIEYSDSSYGEGYRYTDNYKDAVNFFNKVSADTCFLTPEQIHRKAKEYLKTSLKRKLIKDKDKLKVGDCTCVIRNKYNGQIRLAKGSVSLVPYKKDATMEIKRKFGKNLVYVLYRGYEEIDGYYQ